MYKRETRFKGQKRVSVGRMTRHSEPPELKPKDSLRESNHEDPTRAVRFNDASANVTMSQVSDSLVLYCWRSAFRVVAINVIAFIYADDSGDAR